MIFNSDTNDDTLKNTGEEIPLKKIKRFFLSEEIAAYPVSVVNNEITFDVRNFNHDTIYTTQFGNEILGFRFTSQNRLELFSIGVKADVLRNSRARRTRGRGGIYPVTGRGHLGRGLPGSRRKYGLGTKAPSRPSVLAGR